MCIEYYNNGPPLKSIMLCTRTRGPQTCVINSGRTRRSNDKNLPERFARTICGNVSSTGVCMLRIQISVIIVAV